MNFNDHSRLKGFHAFLSPSNYHRFHKNREELRETFFNAEAAKRGSELHEHAANCIHYKTKLEKRKTTLNMYVNDAIGYGMKEEQVLYYSDNCFGTADAIMFDEKKKFLRIHDLKTGVTPASMEQLEIYAALFCLEYNFNPSDIHMELRIYQNDEVIKEEPDPEIISDIMEWTKAADKDVTLWRMEGL